MKQSVHNIKLSLLLLVAIISFTANAQTAPELVFRNGVLKSGTANKEGATYRFANVTTGVDAELKLKKFSRNDITMADVDLSSLGWDKALQPQFGLAGLVAPYQNWYIDFELSFFEAGSNKKQKMQQVVLTALDVDGDGWSINEYAIFNNPNSTQYSSNTSLLGNTPAALTLDANGESTTNFTCDIDGISQKVQTCSHCNGTGVDNGSQCDDCDGSGLLYKQCHHPYDLNDISQGTVLNYTGIDTSATQVMVTYTYLNKDKITFRYGAQSGAFSSNGSGIRLNSLWGKQFSLAPISSLPVTFTSFGVLYNNATATVNWTASYNEQLSHFVIQRSTDGKTYTDVATVFADASANYSYKDKNVSSATGAVYYRILSVDVTKETAYSGIKMVRLSKTELQTLALTTYPNPVSNEVRVTLPNNWQGKNVVLQLYTANGTVAKTIQVGSASQTETMAISNLAKGLYVVKAACGDESAQQRIVKN